MRPVQGEEGRMKQHLTGSEVASLLGVDPATVRAWRSRGQGPPYNQPAGKGTQATYDPDVVALFAASWRKGQRYVRKVGG